MPFGGLYYVPLMRTNEINQVCYLYFCEPYIYFNFVPLPVDPCDHSLNDLVLLSPY